ncbi:MAG: ABC transporter permease [Deltaproteobacteria bacterium]|nr:ABC transporter permease [Deltaproteobacteria bacterium]
MSLLDPYDETSPSARRNLGLATVAFVLVTWSLLSGLELVEKAKLPSPWAVAVAFTRLAWDAERGSLLLTATIASVTRILAASVLVFIVGIPVGILMGSSPRINAALSPLVDPFRSAPIVAVFPIFVMWLGIDEAVKIAFLFAGAVVYLVPMVRDAIQAVPSTYWVSARDLGATPFEAIRLSVLPMAMPRIADGVITAVSVMWTYITVAEYVNADKGLGQLIQNARRASAMDKVFVGIFVIVALALLNYQFMVWAKRRLFPWEVA